MQIEGFDFPPPAGFRTEDVTVAYRQGLPGTGPSASLIVQSKPARAGASLGDFASETLSELAQTVPKMKNASKAEFAFDDGGKGIILAYSLQAQTGELRQYFVLRLEKGRLCTITLTVPNDKLTEASAKTLMNAIAKVKPL